MLPLYHPKQPFFTSFFHKKRFRDGVNHYGDPGRTKYPSEQETQINVFAQEKKQASNFLAAIINFSPPWISSFFSKKIKLSLRFQKPLLFSHLKQQHTFLAPRIVSNLTLVTFFFFFLANTLILNLLNVGNVSVKRGSEMVSMNRNMRTLIYNAGGFGIPLPQRKINKTPVCIQGKKDLRKGAKREGTRRKSA